MESEIRIPQSCTLCPRMCGADRRNSRGRCGGGAQVRVARAAPHFWEEPCLSGDKGSGTVFFSGCSLQCCFCQNFPISAQNEGRDISVSRLADIFLELQDQGVHNLNLVNPTHNQPWILKALELARPRLQLPVVWNSGGYERTETLGQLEGLVDIYLPDIKFFDKDRGARYADAPDYFSRASEAVLEMHRQTGSVVFEGALLKKGLIVRHLVLPKGRGDSKQILRWLKEHLPAGAFRLSLMSQYTPFYRSGEFPEINRRISTFEYHDVLDYACSLGLEGYMQEKSSAREEYTPSFDLTGV